MVRGLFAGVFFAGKLSIDRSQRRDGPKIAAGSNTPARCRVAIRTRCASRRTTHSPDGFPNNNGRLGKPFAGHRSLESWQVLPRMRAGRVDHGPFRTTIAQEMPPGQYRRHLPLAPVAVAGQYRLSGKFDPVKSRHFGEWCNGSTADSGSACLGSNPSSPDNLTPVSISISDWRFFLHFPSSVKIPPFSHHSEKNTWRSRTVS